MRLGLSSPVECCGAQAFLRPLLGSTIWLCSDLSGLTQHDRRRVACPKGWAHWTEKYRYLREARRDESLLLFCAAQTSTSCMSLFSTSDIPRPSRDRHRRFPCRAVISLARRPEPFITQTGRSGSESRASKRRLRSSLGPDRWSNMTAD